MVIKNKILRQSKSVVKIFNLRRKKN